MSVLRGEGVGPQMNKFEQVSSDHQQMSVAGGRLSQREGRVFQRWVGCTWGRISQRGGGRVSYHVAYAMMHLTKYPPPREQTDAC